MAPVNSGSGVGPATVSTSCMTVDARDRVDHRGRSGRGCASLLTPSPPDAGVVVVLRHQQVRGRARGTTAPSTPARSTPCRPSRTRRARRAAARPASKCSSQPRQWFERERVLEHAEVDVAVGADGRRRGAVVVDERRSPAVRIRRGAARRRWRGVVAVEREQVAGAAAEAVAVAHGDVERAAVVAERRRALCATFVIAGVAGGGRGGDPRAGAVVGDARDAALRGPAGVGAGHLEAEEDVARGVGGDRRVDEDVGRDTRAGRGGRSS